MKNYKKIVLKGILFMVLILCVISTWFYLEVLLPYRTITDLSWWIPIRAEKEYVPNSKVRNACHKALKYRFTYHYDATLALRYVGNKDSIPYLIRTLKWEYLKRQDKMMPGNRLLGTLGYCVGSLEKLTGMDFGTDCAAWEKWWKETGQHLPFDETKGQLVLPEETQ